MKYCTETIEILSDSEDEAMDELADWAMDVSSDTLVATLDLYTVTTNLSLLMKMLSPLRPFWLLTILT